MKENKQTPLLISGCGPENVNRGSSVDKRERATIQKKIYASSFKDTLRESICCAGCWLEPNPSQRPELWKIVLGVRGKKATDDHGILISPLFNLTFIRTTAIRQFNSPRHESSPPIKQRPPATFPESYQDHDREHTQALPSRFLCDFFASCPISHTSEVGTD